MPEKKKAGVLSIVAKAEKDLEAYRPFEPELPVMQSAIDLLPILGNNKKVILRAVGNSIPNAVAVANIITEKMLHGNSKVQKSNLILKLLQV